MQSKREWATAAACDFWAMLKIRLTPVWGGWVSKKGVGAYLGGLQLQGQTSCPLSCSTCFPGWTAGVLRSCTQAASAGCPMAKLGWETEHVTLQYASMCSD